MYGCVFVWGYFSMCGNMGMEVPKKGRGIRSPETGVVKQLWLTWCKYWELKSGTLKKHCGLLTSESFQQLPHLVILCYAMSCHVMLCYIIIIDGFSHWLWSSLIWLGWLASKLYGSTHLYLHSNGFRDINIPLYPAFTWVLGNLNSGLFGHAAGTLLFEASPQPLSWDLNDKIQAATSTWGGQFLLYKRMRRQGHGKEGCLRFRKRVNKAGVFWRMMTRTGRGKLTWSLRDQESHWRV